MAKRKEEDPPAGSPAWMATFSDLMNLLLCFFVMLFAMSSIEEEKLEAFVAAMNNTISIFDAGATAIGDGVLISNGVSQLNELDEYINSTGKTADTDSDSDVLDESNKSPDSDELAEMLKEQNLQENEQKKELIEEALQENRIADEVEVSFNAQYVLLSMNGSLLFESGRAELTQGAQGVLDKVGVILESFADSSTIEIVGHTDNVPIHNAQYASNEELSSSRSLSVFYYLRDTTFLDPANLKHAGMGERDPIADNATEEGRNRNRRVEIRIYNPTYM